MKELAIAVAAMMYLFFVATESAQAWVPINLGTIVKAGHLPNTNIFAEKMVVISELLKTGN
jgi:hypothetical protein